MEVASCIKLSKAFFLRLQETILRHLSEPLVFAVFQKATLQIKSCIYPALSSIIYMFYIPKCSSKANLKKKKKPQEIKCCVIFSLLFKIVSTFYQNTQLIFQVELYSKEQHHPFRYAKIFKDKSIGFHHSGTVSNFYMCSANSLDAQFRR